MRALFYHGPEDVRVETVDDPTPDDADGVVVRIEKTGICGSDLHIYHGGLAPGPYGIGHEGIGEVVETGSRVRRFRPGDRVLISGAIGCAECLPCSFGKVTSCEREGGRVFGTSPDLAGAQAEAIPVPLADATLCRIPEGLSDKSAVLLTDILPTGYFGAENAEIQPGQDIAVIGCGPVGLMAIQSALLFGPRRVFAIDRIANRLASAEALGAIPIDAKGDAIAEVREATGGLGPHAVIEAVGADATILDALELVRRGGIVSVIGVNANPEFTFPMSTALFKNLSFKIGVCPIPSFWSKLVPLLQEGRLQPDGVFTHEFGLGAGPDAYQLFASRDDGVLKVLLDPAS